ncbi:DUF1064 domain-containing protein (plasmid) [Furfurilactobacillus rossiae]|uniref:DUF1064 domain-containing protein n=1 Tax=Furfurilactobacillus rossiae TaxID=231049 RepID=UPI001F44967F|nr:DUF1064 domain-containing protein [Furfurilactobacillus rossiae]MCF6164792.1 DUF1064 domain-containing protein [Furfurilactobacillus rossiae]
MNSPTALNKRGTKIEKWGQKFDSQKELDFYERFILKQVDPKHVSVHPKFVLANKTVVQQGAAINSIRYTPDFIIYDDFMHILHVYDVKNSFGIYGIDNGNRITFRLFAMHIGVPVEAVVVRKHDFKAACIGVTKQLNLTGKAKTPKPIVRNDVFYNWMEATNY